MQNALAKASFTNVTAKGKPIPVHFNPVSLQYGISNTLGKIGSGDKTKQVVSSSTATLTLELSFDSTDTGRDVREATGPIARLMRAEKDNTPPVVLVIREFGASAADRPDKRLPLIKRYPAPAGATPLVWVSESFLDLYRERLHLDNDGTFDLPLPMNPNGVAAMHVRMAGVWRDYARQHGSLVINFADYARVTGDRRTHDAALWMREGITASGLLTALKARLPDFDTLDIAETADVRALSLKIFDRTFAVTYALEAVAVLIGLAGMVAAFMGLIVARKKEFGMLRHLGLTRRELTSMLTLEGAALAALGALLGLVLGVILAAILVFVINPQSFGWSMDFHIPLLQLAAFSAMLIAAAAGAAWLTARHVLGTQDLVRSVREDW